MKACIEILLLLLLFAPAARAWPPTFGAELTFTNDLVANAYYGEHGNHINSPMNMIAQAEMAKQLDARCRISGACQVETVKDHYGNDTPRVVYNDGWWFQVTLDPSVLEVQMKPSTLEEHAAHAPFVERDLFGTAKELGLKPHDTLGGGHIHLGLASTFGGDARLFRDFIVDFANHPGLASGALSQDFGNAPPISELQPEQRKAFREVIAEFDAGRITTIEGLATGIQERVYTASPRHSPPQKYQALNVTKIIDPNQPNAERTLEIRALRPQRSFAEYLLVAKLFQTRLEYLKTLSKPVKFLDRPTPFGGDGAAKDFYSYVTTAGLNPDDYIDLLPMGLWGGFKPPRETLWSRCQRLFTHP